MDFGPEAVAWMKAHTLGDLKSLAANMESKGEDASKLWEFAHTLHEIENSQARWMGSV